MGQAGRLCSPEPTIHAECIARTFDLWKLHCVNSTPISTPRWLGLLFRMQREMLRARLGQFRGQSRLLQAVLGTFLIGYVVMAYLLFYHGLAFVNRFPLIGTLISQRVLYLLFAFFFLMLIFSNLIIGYSTLFRNRETAWWVTLPVDHRDILRWKWLECLTVSSWALIFLSAPLMAAYGRLYGVGWTFYLFVPLLYLPFIVIPAVLGVSAILLLVRLLVQPWLGKTALLLALLAALAWVWLIKPQAATDGTTTSEGVIFEKLLRHSRVVVNPALPSTWLVQGLLNWKDGTPTAAVFWFGVLLSHALLVGWIGFEFASRLFYGSLGAALRLQAARQVPILTPEGKAKVPWLERWLAGSALDRQFAALALKDARIFWRDPGQWIQCVIFFGLLALYFANLRNMKLDFDNPFWPTLISYLNLMAASLTLSTLTTRFVYPQFSLEGKRLWILGLAPLGLGRVVGQKFWTSTLATWLVTIPLMILSGVILRQPWSKIGLFIVAGGLMGASLSALAAGLGALFPNLKEDNPTKIVSGFGGTFCLISSFLYIVVFICLLAVPALATFNPVMAPFSRWTPLCLAGALGWSALNIFLPVRLAQKRVKSLEF